MLRLTLAAVALSATALSVFASPLYLSVPSRNILKAEDFEKSGVGSPYAVRPSAKDASHEALAIMLQGRALRNEDDGNQSTPFHPMHVGNRTIIMGPGPVRINHTRHLGPDSIIVGGSRTGHGRNGTESSGSAGSSRGGTVINNGTQITNSGGANQSGSNGTSTVGNAQAGEGAD